MRDETREFLECEMEDLKFDFPDTTDYKGQLEVRKGNEDVLRRKIRRLEKELSAAKNDPRFKLAVCRDHMSLDYRLTIMIDSYQLRAMHPGGHDQEYLMPIAKDIMYKAMSELQKVLDPTFPRA